MFVDCRKHLYYLSQERYSKIDNIGNLLQYFTVNKHILYVIMLYEILKKTY